MPPIPVFIRLTDANFDDPAFWAGQNVDANSTIDARNLSDDIRITMTGSSITFTDTTTGTTSSFTNADLAGGSFSQFVEFRGNDADNDVSGSVGLNSGGYIGGAGDDRFVDDGNRGGQIRGRDGDDILIGGVGDNNIDGGRGNDILRGGQGNNNLRGGQGDDTLFAEDGSGNLIGGSGDDTIYSGLDTTFVRGGSGTDTLLVPPGSTITPFSPGSDSGLVTLPNGNFFVYQTIEDFGVTCFTPGTRIRTPDGDVAVDALAVGDLVETLDHGAQPIRWIGRRTVSGLGRHAPIRFAPGTIGNADAIRVSPQHRVLISGWQCELWFHQPEMLCAAKLLCDGERVRRDICDRVTYIHLMLDRHEILFAEDAPMESFHVGARLAEADLPTYLELVALFPELAEGRGSAGPPARRFVKSFEAPLLN